MDLATLSYFPEYSTNVIQSTPVNRKETELTKFSGRGEVYSFTVVSREAAPEDFVEFAPYPVALVKLEEGPLVTAMLTDIDNNDIFIGMKVEMVTRLLRKIGDKGLLIYGYKFRPVLTRS